MNILLFAAAFLGVFILLNMYISKRFITKLDIREKHKKLLRFFLLINFLGIVGYMLGRYYTNIPNWLYFLFSLPMGVIFLLFCTAIFYDISSIICSSIPMSGTRRKFFKNSLDISSLFIAASLSARAMYEARFVKLEKVVIKIKNLQQSYKIVQISDLHIGGLIDAQFVREIVLRINALTADIVVITGDLVDIDVKHAKAPLHELQNLRSRYGTYYIVGNHEYFHDVQKIIDTVTALEIKVLENENVYIGEANKGFHLAGVYDIFGYKTLSHMPDLNKALHNTQNAPTILLAHQPRFIQEIQNGVDLVLSGHTHGGQIYPFKFLVQLQQPYISGLHQHNDKMQIYVNKGTGFWGPPMRLGASSEITEILLEPDF